MHKHRTLDDTIYFWFAANLTTGTAGDGSSPTFAVRKAGAGSSAAPTLTGTPTLLSNAGYSDGSYEIAVAATTANGFVADAEYSVFCSLSISSVNPNGFVGSFVLSPIRTLLTGDAFARIGSNGAGLTAIGDTRMANLDATVSSRLASASYTTPPTTAQIEAALLNEGDGQALVAAIIARIESDLDGSDVSVAAIATACRNAILDRVLASNHETAGSAGKLLQNLAGHVPQTGDTYGLLVVASGMVTAAATPAADSFSTTLTAGTGTLADLQLKFKAGDLTGQNKPITTNMETNGVVLFSHVSDYFTAAPAVGDAFDVIGLHIHGINDIAGAVRDVSNTAPAADSLGAGIKTINTILAGITSLADWFRRVFRGDAGTAGMIAAQAEINTGGTSTFDGTTDNLEDIYTAAAAASGGGGGPVTASVSVPAATARAVLQGVTIGVTRGDTLRVSLTGLGDLSGRQKLWFTVKRSKLVADSEAIIQIEETDSLTLLNAAAPSSAAWGTMTVTDQAAGDVDIVLYASATKLLAEKSGLIWDVKQSLGSSPDDATTQMEGKMNVELNVTQATS